MAHFSPNSMTFILYLDLSELVEPANQVPSSVQKATPTPPMLPFVRTDVNQVVQRPSYNTWLRMLSDESGENGFSSSWFAFDVMNAWAVYVLD